MKPRLRIVNEGDIAGPETSVLLVKQDEDGSETVEDITQAIKVTRIRIDLPVGGVSSAKLDCICVRDEIDAVLDDLVVRHVGPSRFGRLLWRLKKHWWGVGRRVDTTTFGSRWHEQLPGLHE